MKILVLAAGLSSLLYNPATARAEEVIARVTIGQSLGFVRCSCPLDSSLLPSILEEVDYCDFRVASDALACNDAVLRCERLMMCWTPRDIFVCPCVPGLFKRAASSAERSSRVCRLGRMVASRGATSTGRQGLSSWRKTWLALLSTTSNSGGSPSL
mmetsp:Transcript_34761/g.83124  ORF Transcript_34761/g.83124 Transcript_34761/m.83124 type:complete len:156 (+) Transcript_34761:70-537(+)